MTKDLITFGSEFGDVLNDLDSRIRTTECFILEIARRQGAAGLGRPLYREIIEEYSTNNREREEAGV